MKSIVLSTVLTFSSILVTAQSFDWVKIIGGPNFDFGSAMTIDDIGNIYVTGSYDVTADFDPSGLGYFLNSSGLDDAFIAKYNSNGEFIWAKGFGGNLPEFGTGITVDAQGNVYTTGVFQSAVDFDPGAGSFLLDTEGGTDVFVVKLDSEGGFVWAKQLGGNSADYATGIALDSNSNVLITGYFQGTVDFNPGPITSNIASTTGSRDAFVWKLDSNGNYVWGAKLGGSAEDKASAITIDASDNIYTLGTFIGTADFNPGSGSNTLTAQSTNQDVFISKLNSSSEYITAYSTGGFDNDFSYQIEVDDNQNIYFGTSFFGTTSLISLGGGNISSLGFEDALIIKLHSNGTLDWVHHIGGSGYDRPWTIELDSENSLFTLGTFEGQNIDFDPGFNSFIMSSVGGEDIFMLKQNNNGELEWAKSFGGTEDEAIKDVKISASGDLISQGNYYGLVDFDPDSPVSNSTAQGSDIFIHKMTLCQTTSSTINATACEEYQSPSGDFIWTVTGIYNDVIPNALGCDSLITVNLTIPVIDVGVVDFSPSLFATASNAEFQWLDCNDAFSVIDGENQNEFVATSNGQFAVQVTQNGCSDISDCISVSNVSVQLNNSLEQLDLYPNPGNGKFKIKGNTNQIEAIRILDLSGRIINRFHNLNLRDWFEVKATPGVYLVQFLNNDTVFQTKILVKE